MAHPANLNFVNPPAYQAAPAIDLHLEKIFELGQQRERALEELTYLRDKKQKGSITDANFFDRALPFISEERKIYKELRDLQKTPNLTKDAEEICANATGRNAVLERAAIKWDLRELAHKLGKEADLERLKEKSEGLLDAIPNPVRASRKVITDGR